MAIKFGTSGVRGLVEEFTADEVEKYVTAFLRHAERVASQPQDCELPGSSAGEAQSKAKTSAVATGQGKTSEATPSQNETTVSPSKTKRQKVYLGMDRRESSPEIALKVLRTLQTNGYEFEYHGQVPTPCLANYSIRHGGLGIVVTGSHVPADRNGIKFYLPSGETLKSDEAGIEALAQTVATGHASDTNAKPLATNCKTKTNANANAKPSTDTDSTTNTEGNTKLTTQNHSDQESHGAAWLAQATKILAHPRPEAEDEYVARYLDFFKGGNFTGCRVLLYEHSAVGSKILSRILEVLGCEVIRRGYSAKFVPVDTENLENLAMLKDWVLNENADFLVSTDGDSDRPLIVDDRGQVLRGDQIGMLLAQFLRIEYLAVPVSTLSSVSTLPSFKKVLLTRIGSPYVIEGMRQLMREYPQGVVAGFEANGGFLLATPVTLRGKTLGALETRDAVLPIVGLIAHCREQGRALSELRHQLPARFSGSSLIKPVPGDAAQQIIAEAAAQPGPFARDYLPFMKSPVCGFSALDGARFTFANGEVIHLRQSGNAPEFRCYSEADDEAAAQHLSELALNTLAELRQLKINKLN